MCGGQEHAFRLLLFQPKIGIFFLSMMHLVHDASSDAVFYVNNDVLSELLFKFSSLSFANR